MTRLFYCLILGLIPLLSSAQTLDFSKTTIYSSDRNNIPAVLQEELHLRTNLLPDFAGKPVSKGA